MSSTSTSNLDLVTSLLSKKNSGINSNGIPAMLPNSGSASGAIDSMVVDLSDELRHGTSGISSSGSSNSMDLVINSLGNSTVQGTLSLKRKQRDFEGGANLTNNSSISKSASQSAVAEEGTSQMVTPPAVKSRQALSKTKSGSASFVVGSAQSEKKQGEDEDLARARKMFKKIEQDCLEVQEKARDLVDHVQDSVLETQVELVIAENKVTMEFDAKELSLKISKLQEIIAKANKMATSILVPSETPELPMDE